MHPRQASCIIMPNVAIFSIQIGMLTPYIPPRAVVMNRTVVARPLVIIAIFRAELLTVLEIQIIAYQNILLLKDFANLEKITGSRGNYIYYFSLYLLINNFVYGSCVGNGVSIT